MLIGRELDDGASPIRRVEFYTGCDTKSTAEKETLPLWARVVGGTDLTGDDRFAHSTLFSGALLLEMLLYMVSVYMMVTAFDFQTERWESLLHFLAVLFWCFVTFAIAGVFAIGNSELGLLHCGKGGVLVSMVLVLTWFLCSYFTRRRETVSKEFDIFLDFGHALALVAMIGALLRTCLSLKNPLDNHPMLIFPSFVQSRSVQDGGVEASHEVGEASAADAKENAQESLNDLQWGVDDLHGLERAASITRENSYYSGAPRTLFVGPDIVKGLISYVFPRPFDFHDKFPMIERRKYVAARVRVRYPSRLFVALASAAMFITLMAVTIISDATSNLKSSADSVELFFPSYPTDEDIDQAEQQLEDATTELESSARSNVTTQTVALSMMLWASENQGMLAQCIDDVNKGVPTNCTSSFEDSLSQLLSTQDLYNRALAHLESVTEQVNDIRETRDNLEDFLEDIGTIVITSACVALVTSYWFMFVAVLAFRKTLLELLLSSPSFPFSPLLHHCAKDQKFVAVVSVSIVVSFSLMFILLVAIGIFLTWEPLWDILADYVMQIVAFCVYEALVLLVVPLVSKKVTLDKHMNLVNPRRQALLIFVWEMFYFPQVTMSVLLKVVYSFSVAVGMLLRPDAPCLPTEWAWLDSLHSSYIATLHSQIVASQLRLLSRC
uniref:Transmembrane protein n=1 Tax=Noctiluca scintillans TaxID=2966 RepID=A0A7S1A359_NOCSC|mmetsp:Transcript_29914/g.79656  ORF Transcript_29914/g.79656 Transcript_29914/m.79656 type:complete len:667 (+) Transcript_29914:40-2040(+)